MDSVKKIDGRSKNGGHSTAGFAGKKPKPAAEKKVTSSVAFDPENYKWILENTSNRSKFINQLVAEYRLNKSRYSNESL